MSEPPPPRITAWMGVCSDRITPEEISERLGVEARVTSRERKRAFSTGHGWDSSTVEGDPWELASYVENLVATFRPQKAAIQDLSRSPGTDVLFFLGVLSEERGSTPSIIFPPSLLAELTEFGVVLEIDFLC